MRALQVTTSDGTRLRVRVAQEAMEFTPEQGPATSGSPCVVHVRGEEVRIGPEGVTVPLDGQGPRIDEVLRPGDAFRAKLAVFQNDVDNYINIQGVGPTYFVPAIAGIPASVCARMVISIRRTSGCWMIGPNCTRSRA